MNFKVGDKFYITDLEACSLSSAALTEPITVESVEWKTGYNRPPNGEDCVYSQGCYFPIKYIKHVTPLEYLL